MTLMLEQIAAFFHEDFDVEFAESTDIIGDILSRYDNIEKTALRAEITNLVSLSDPNLQGEFDKLGFAYAPNSAAGLRAFFSNIIDRIDSRDAPLMTLPKRA